VWKKIDMSMILAIDIGNTHTVLGVFRRTKLVADWRMTSVAVGTEDELWITMKMFFDHARVAAGDMTDAVISSVVPNLTSIFEMTLVKYLHLRPVVVSATLDFGMSIKYDSPKTVGADRICNAVAAYDKYGGPCIIVDFGTATTFDVVSKKGEYLGGVIAPGVETSSINLQRRTALLPKIDLQFPKSVIGTNTIASMQSGILYSAVDAMEGMIKRIKKTIGNNATVVATGGFSKLIASKSKTIDHVEPSLVLEGARLIYERTHTKHR
jgi:type III pantothenate kinase